MEKLFKLQQEIGKISKTQDNPFYKSKYFDINKLLEHLMPLCEKHKILIIQPLTTTNERPAIETSIIDIETKDVLLSGTITLPDLQDPQKMGSAITYYRRYALQSALGLQAEDDDGNYASGKNNKKEQETNLNKVKIINFFKNQPDINPKTKEDYEEACMAYFNIELKEENYNKILELIK